MKDRQILVSVVTTDNPDWEKQIEDLEKYNIEKCALFLSSADQKIRNEIYDRLNLIDIEIPFCHARTDMSTEEIMALQKKYHTQYFNLHPLSEYPLQYDYSKIKDSIIIENLADYKLVTEDLDKFAGICIDLSHLESARRSNKENYDNVLSLSGRYPVYANHISAVVAEPYDPEGLHYDVHVFKDLKDFDYLTNLPQKAFSNIMAIEVANKISEQLEAKNYIENKLNINN